MRKPAMKNGMAPGMRRRMRICQRLALFILKYESKPGSTLRRPIVVLEIIGKTAMTAAQSVSAQNRFLIRMMIKGATAAIGVTYSMMA